ncbi:hypothetical protein ABL78_2021 [Leptomonas seymouri]|uniref:HECT domain-containing protein n=1 Tax=Leptomonas seymouri TaxID=5684 RepID=A0A0N1PEG6_LEPSE|nr:hypothetical protein ABL78_2021 [Leptomonas seymouri]|eukprot:KPI88904.1 hypothetical protein ABL78_2021 [Leptomonas seymouri]
MQQQSLAGMNAYFEPAAAIAACKAEDVMSIPAYRLAQVAWPLLSDAERTLSMRDILFTPPMRVSASARATEAAFSAGVQACLTELTENLQRVSCGESPISVARLRSAALAYQINAASKWPTKLAQRSTSGNTTSSSKPQGSSNIPFLRSAQPAGTADAFFDFAFPSFMPPDDAEEGIEATALNADECGVLPATAIHSNSHNTPLDSSGRALPGAAGEFRRRVKDDAQEQAQDTAASSCHSAADRENYERKRRSFVSEFVDSQWESVVSSALRSDDTINTAKMAAASKKARAIPNAAMLRHTMLRTALLLCHQAPNSSAAGHSFVSLLRHALRAVAATSTIRRCTDDTDSNLGNALAPTGATAAGGIGNADRAAVLASSAALTHLGVVGDGQTKASSATSRGLKGASADRCTKGPSESPSQATATAEAAAAAAQQSVLRLQASLWVEVVLPLLHCVPLVLWTDDVLVELGQVLETIAAAPPPKLVAIAQRQQQPQLSPTAATGRHAGPSKRAKSGLKKAACMPSSTTTSLGGGVGIAAEQMVDFNVCIPFKIGLSKRGVAEGGLFDSVHYSGDASAAGDGQQRAHQLSISNGSTTSAMGNNASSYPSSAFHEVPDVWDAAEVTEEMSVVEEEEEREEDAADDDYTTTSASSVTSSLSSSSSAETERASVLHVSVNSQDYDDVDFATLFGGLCGEFEAQPCRHRCTQMVEFSFPCATRVSVRLLESVDWDRYNPRGRDVLLLPLESMSASAEKSAAASESQPVPAPATAQHRRSSSHTHSSRGVAVGSLAKAKDPCKETLPLSLQSLKAGRNEALTHSGPCRVAIPSLPQRATHIVSGEVSAHLQLTLDTRWSTEWTIALSLAQRTVAERLLSLIETRACSSADNAQQRLRSSRIASCVLLRDGLNASASGATSERKAYATAASAAAAAHLSAASATSPATVPSAAASAPAALPSSITGLDAFIVTLMEMPLNAFRARVRCHTTHAEGVRATLVLIACAFLQDRLGYLNGDPLAWHSAAWSEAVRQVSLASDVVGSAVGSGCAAMEVALFFASHVASSCAVSTITRAQVIDAAIGLMSIPGLSVADVKTALEDRRQLSNTMWIVVVLLNKCVAVARAPKHVALVSQATRRLLILGCPSTQAAALSPSAATQRQQQHRQHVPWSSTAHPPSMNAPVLTAAGMGATVAAASATGEQSNHYLSLVRSCGRAMEINLRRGVHDLLTQLFRLLKALLHRIHSTQAAPHRFLLESWEYGAFAVLTVSLMATPMDASDVRLCAPFFADVVTGLLPSFTRLSRTESLLLTSESEEHKFLVEVAKYVRGRSSTSVAAFMGEDGGAELGEADIPASREPQILRKVDEVARSRSTAPANGEGVGVWDVLQGATAASWTPGHVRVEIWNGSCSGFYVGFASADLPSDVCGPERDPNGIYFIGDGTLQYGDVTRKQWRLPRWHAGDVVELNFVFASGNWDVVMALNGVTMVRLTLPRRDFRLVAVNVRAGEYVPGNNHVYVLSVSPIYGKSSATTDRRRKRGSAARATAALPPSPSASNACAAAPADVRLSPFSRLTVFNVSLFLELVLHYLVLHSSRRHHVSVASSAAAASAAGAVGGATLSTAHAGPPSQQGPRGLLRRSTSSAALAVSHAGDHNTAVAAAAAVTPLTTCACENVHLVQVCTAPLQHSLQQLVSLLHDLSHSDNTNSSSNSGKGDSANDTEAYEVKRTAALHISNALLLDLVVTLSISLPSSTSTLAMTVDVLTAVVECEAVARKTHTVALSALYNAITQHAFREAISPGQAGSVRRLWAACYRLASGRPDYQPRFSTASVPAGPVVVLAGGRRIEHRRASVSTALSGNVRSMSYACNPIDLDDRETPDVVRVSVRMQRGFQCETLGRYYYFGLADIAPTPTSTPIAQGSTGSTSAPLSGLGPSLSATATATAGELTKHPGERAKQRRTYLISDYLSEVPEAAVQKTEVECIKNYLNPESNIIFGSGDVMTAVVYVRERWITFERNGLPLNVLYHDIPASVHRLYPFVELYNRDSRAKWMYPPDETVMSARYTMRAMLLSWPNIVLPLVKEYLPKFDASKVSCAAADPQSFSAPLTRSSTDSANNSRNHSNALLHERNEEGAHDVVLGVLGADGDEMRVVYVAPPQLDQPGGRAQTVRVERFERGMAVVSDEAGSLQRVCAAALEPDTTAEVHVLPTAALRSVVQACLPELAMFATQCLQGLLAVGDAKKEGTCESAQQGHAPPKSTATEEKAGGRALASCQMVLHRPATLLRVLRLIFSLNGHVSSPTSATPMAVAAAGAANRGGRGTPQANALSLSTAATTTPALAEPIERAMLTLLPLLDALLPISQLDLPPSVLLREAWNELWCNPDLRRRVDIAVPRCPLASIAAVDSQSVAVKTRAKQHGRNEKSEGGARGLSTNSEELDHTYTEPAGVTYGSSAQRFEDRLRWRQLDGDRCLCPSCGKRWSACTSYHTVPSSWCDLLDRVFRLLQRQSVSPSLKQLSSPYCGWFAEWTDGPLEAPRAQPAVVPPEDSAKHPTSGGHDPQVPSPAQADEDGAYHSPMPAELSDAQLWEDADDTSAEEEEAVAGDSDGSDGAAATAAAASDRDEGGAHAEVPQSSTAAPVPATRTGEKSNAALANVDEAPMTLVVRRVQRPSNEECDANDEDDGVVFVEGSGETRQASFTFTGTLISPTLLRGQMTFDRIDLPDAGESSASEEWACPLCTFLNEPSAVRCAICANARPGASWTCPVCSYAYNTLASATCVTCGCMRPNSVRRLHDATGPSGYCTKCNAREHFRNFHAMRYRHYCFSCGIVTRWLPKDKFITTIEARLVGDGGMLEFQWALDGYNTVCFGLRTPAYSADELWNLVDAVARGRGSSAWREVGRYVQPIPERPLSTPSPTPAATAVASSSSCSAASSGGQPCIVGAIVYYASALVLRYARLLPVEQLADPGFLRRLHICGPEWLDSWTQFPISVVKPVFSQCLKLLQDGVRQPELVSTIATVALALIRQQPHVLGLEKHALLYALCLNVVRYGDAAQRKASYTCINALMEDDPAAALNVQPLVPVLSMEPPLEGQQRATVLALLHHASMSSTPAIAKACACMARTVEAMERQLPLPPMLGKPFPYLVALTETQLNEGGELLVGQVRGSIGVAPTKGGKYYYEVEVPHEFLSDRSKTIVMGWGTVEHERTASAQHVGSDLHSWGFNCRENLRLMMTEQALPVPRRPNQGDVIGSMMDLETMMVCWTINGQEISWVSVPAQGYGEAIFPYVSASVEPQSVKIRLGNTRFKPAGYRDYTPPSDCGLWAGEADSSPGDNDGEDRDAPKPAAAGTSTRTPPPSHPPQSYEFYQQLSLALEEASITTLDDTSVFSLLDTRTARSVLRQYPKLLALMLSAPHDSRRAFRSVDGDAQGERGAPAAATQAGEAVEDVQLLIPYIQQLRRAQELTVVVTRHLSLIEKSPYLMSCYKKATDLLFSSGRWTIFELQPGGRPKYNGGHSLRVLVSVRKAKHVRKEADAEWLAQHPHVVHQQNLPQPSASSAGVPGAQLTEDDSLGSPRPSHTTREAAHNGDHSSSNSSNTNASARQRAVHTGEDHGSRERDEEDEYVDVEGDEDGGNRNAGAAAGDSGRSASLDEVRKALQDIYGDGSQLSPSERRLRCSVTGQLFTQLEKARVYQRARMFAVQLEGTLAVDAGGVTRAVMSMLGEELSYRFVRGVRVDPLLPLFQLCGHSTVFTVVPNMSALYASEAADDGAEGGLLRRMFVWLGKLMGNMVLCGTLKVPFDFPRLLWKTLTFQEDTITLQDYAYDIDDNIIAALEDDEFVLSDEFFDVLPERVRASSAFLKSLQGGSSSGGSSVAGDARGGEGSDCGGASGAAVGCHTMMPSARPLRPYVCMTPAMSMQDMSHFASEELDGCVEDAEAAEGSRRRALAQEALLHQYDPAFLAIRSGLTAVVPASSLRSVRWEDLRARVCGNGAVSMEHVLAELDMSPLSPSMRAMLTQVLSSFTESQLSRFLLFCSGQSRIPLPEKVLVNCGDEVGRLPTAHTCSPISLLLQPCSTAAELQSSLEACLTHATEFGFV